MRGLTVPAPEPAEERYTRIGMSPAVESVRVTPRGGRDDIDGIETLANGRSVVKVRVRVIAEGGEAYPAGVRDLARRFAEDAEARVQTLGALTSRP